MKHNPEKGVECYIDADFADGLDQEEGKDTGQVIYRTVYVISSANCLII